MFPLNILCNDSLILWQIFQSSDKNLLSDKILSCRNIRQYKNDPLKVFRIVLESPFSFLKDTHREKAPSNKTPALKKKYKYGHLGCWYNKSTLYKRFLN